MSDTALATYVDAKNQLLSATNGVEYAYRSTGGASDATPLVALQHFRGNLDNWDPALIRTRRLTSPYSATRSRRWRPRRIDLHA